MAKSSSRTSRTYPSKVDVWLVAVIGAALGAAFVGAMLAAIDEGPIRVAQAAFILLGVIGFVAWIFLRTTYTLAGSELIIRSGPFAWRVPVAEIGSIGPATGFTRAIASPALSMDRLLLTYGAGKTMMISPRNQETFLADLAARQ